jgi:hypothetical protein
MCGVESGKGESRLQRHTKPYVILHMVAKLMRHHHLDFLRREITQHGI